MANKFGKILRIILAILLILGSVCLLYVKYDEGNPYQLVIPFIKTVNPLLFILLFALGVYILLKKRDVKESSTRVDVSRRNFLTFAATLAQDEGIHAIQNKMNKGVSAFTGKRNSKSTHPLLPAGALTFEVFKNKCNSCLACVENCPRHILEPSVKIGQGLIPVLNFANGYCDPECTKCNEVCTADAITTINQDDKKKIQIGHAIWLRENCIAVTNGKECKLCMEACPNDCIEIIQNGRKSYPIIDNSKCVGCGACEHACPSSPLKGIYVESFPEHKEIVDLQQEL